jgi:hypothetical protein
MFNIINLAAIFKLDITVRMSIIKILKINAGVISKKTLMLRLMVPISTTISPAKGDKNEKDYNDDFDAFRCSDPSGKQRCFGRRTLWSHEGRSIF